MTIPTRRHPIRCLLACASIAFAVTVGWAQPPSRFELAVVERDGRSTVQGTLPPETFAPRISPDGRRVVFDVFERAGDATRGSVWVASLSDLDGRRRLSPGDAAELFPVWTPDGDGILYISDETGVQTLYSRPADGSGSPRRLVPARAPESFIEGGAVMSFITLKDGDYAVWTLSLDDASEAPLIELPGSAQHSTYFSPDGRWVAYASNETGRFEVWVEPVPTTGRRHQVTTDGGAHPLWSVDGDEIFFDRDGRLFVAPVDTEDGFSAGQPQPLPITGFVQGPNRRQFDLMPGGDRFLMMFPAPDAR